jgi:probable HAF family extracellular repeat protein
MKYLVHGLAALTLLAGGPSRARAGYLITDLGAEFAYGLNDAGQVVGSSGARAYVYSGGKLTFLGASNGEAYGINASGQVVGWEAAQGFKNPFLYGGGSLNLLSAVGPGVAYGINDAGQVVGTSTTYQAFLYSNGQVTGLGALAGPNRSEARGINASGQVAGWLTASDGAMHAFLYSGGKMQDLGTLPGGGWSQGYAINASGQVVGVAGAPDAVSHAFLYSGGKMIDLGALAGPASQANGINDAGQVVGWSTRYRAFLYADGKMIDLNNLLPAGSGWTLLAAQAINNNGQIVGYGTNAAGSRDGFLLTPVSTPEPSALALLALGGAGLLGSAWRRAATAARCRSAPGRARRPG